MNHESPDRHRGNDSSDTHRADRHRPDVLSESSHSTSMLGCALCVVVVALSVVGFILAAIVQKFLL